MLKRKVIPNNSFAISDTHFDDKAILNFANRSRFKNLDEMKQCICDNWNSYIPKDGVVFHLGDVGNPTPENVEMIKNLNGYKIILVGNHDINIQFLKDAFDEVIYYPILIHNWFWLSHEPIYLNSACPYVNIHGHLHEVEYKLDTNGFNQYISACVDMNDYKPINLNLIVNKTLNDLAVMRGDMKEYENEIIHYKNNENIIK